MPACTRRRLHLAACIMASSKRKYYRRDFDYSRRCRHRSCLEWAAHRPFWHVSLGDTEAVSSIRNWENGREGSQNACLLLKQLKSLLPMVKGLAHITGGGLPGNVPRILRTLPPGSTAQMGSTYIFKLILKRAKSITKRCTVFSIWASVWLLLTGKCFQNQSADSGKSYRRCCQADGNSRIIIE